ncbi:MAG: pyridoxamine 5'-phosphate oxidase family protein [Erysipelotrichaceae bacterium]|nr:pyridoxamine 5'-phosphate oxidase family protein [Erysipelotrichaceae bacterium]
MNYEYAQNFWINKDKNSKAMNQEDIKKAIDAFSTSHNTLALATGTGDYVRCTPVEYTYYKDMYWIMSEGGKKYIGLEKNKHVSAAVFDAYTGFGKLKGMQVDGTAEIIEPFSDAYNEFLNLKKIPVEAIRRMEEPMPVICIRPKETDILDSDFKEKGFDSRQHYQY